MHIHTGDEEHEFNLSEVDSINLVESPPEPGEERVFQLTEEMPITMVWIPSGSYMMGAQDGEEHAEEDEYPRHEVTIAYGFWMGQYEVTQAQWVAVMGNNPSHFQGSDNLPVEMVSWDEIHEFTERIGNGFRIPSESEWEYACRAGHDEERFFYGDDGGEGYVTLGNYAWYRDNCDGCTHDVGIKQPSPWGLYDIYGNVYEWCEDEYFDSYEGAPDDGSARHGEGGGRIDRIRRGGSFFGGPRICRSANRDLHSQRSHEDCIGFRVVKDAD